MNVVASHIEGRIRLRHAALRDPAVLREVEGALKEAEGIRSVSGNPRTGSVLVEFDHVTVTAQQVLELTRLPASEPQTAPRARPEPMTPRDKMRIAKRGMLGSLGALLIFAALDRERAHIAAGGLFVAFNAYHLYTYRRRLLV